ncbi:peptidylprolyl isomerase [Oceanospirillaceae bacterium]|jgi:peptidyl-prolyl cis-trans isomerase A (cyclophilin A)|uniref:peptidylprolyl isomerase n=1 Tax=Candidatus Njordibacter sp. Uisw_002 TaxID=3230971 RepID=UPI00233963AC|nr:peptidylprolyl isomerase [Oceanospirillaceae bacterium]MDB9972838.1 peptidylprolyl isomerase [Oceanospirillaceae bacterium]MDC1341580.1 peptidylprolyl isomerase [Oceanospirillaceae bacterium]MDC1509729.1 peptidylprolyl isomerase [Oceanospirillaceae bacterium]|tara:strand:+ start:3726 stop:4301 length:576 start_codon:yes stop_codon:yes gene_type:complete
MKKFFSVLKKSTVIAIAALSLSFSVWAQNPQITLATSLGDIVVELDATAAPVSTDNFLHYVNSGYYNSTIFHRVIPGFMVQGGGFGANEKDKSGTIAPIVNEAANGLSNLRGTIAMARTSNPNSATAQFFINLKDNLFLDKSSSSDGYAVFGKVVEGMDVIDRIAKVPTMNKGGHRDWPSKTIYLNSAQKR